MNELLKKVFFQRPEQENPCNSKNGLTLFSLVFQSVICFLITMGGAYIIHSLLLSDLGKSYQTFKNLICWLILVYNAGIIRDICEVIKHTIEVIETQD